MRIKQTKKRIILSAFVVVFLGAVGFFANKLFINNNNTSAAGDSIAIDYTVDGKAVRKLGNPNLSSNPILDVLSEDYFNRLKSWSKVTDSGKQENEHIVFSNSSVWHEGQRLAGAGNNRDMRPVKYLELPSGDHTWDTEDVSWTVTTDDGYTVNVKILESHSDAPANMYQPFLISETQNSFASSIVFANDCTKAHNGWGYYEMSGSDYPGDNATHFTEQDETGTNHYYAKCDTQWNIDNINKLSLDMPTGNYRSSRDSYNNHPSYFVKLRYTINDAPDSFYLKIDDIDQAQSYSFPNINVCDTTIPITTSHTGGSCNIYVNPEDAETETGNTFSKFQYNMGNSYDENYEDNYIYYDDDTVSVFSSYTPGAEGVTRQTVDNPDTANIYIKFTDPSTQTAGDDDTLGAPADRAIDFVYGFSGGALSRWEFLTQSFDVKFKAQDASGNNIANVLARNGNLINESITDSIYEGETIGVDNIPTLYNGGNPNPYAQYVISYWTANKAIPESGISPTDHITPAEMSIIAQNFGVNDDYEFTAHLAARGNYTITWKNDDGTVLETDENVAYGSTPEYNGNTPTKDKTAQYVYTFAGWTPTISTVTGDAIYTATFDRTLRSDYTITWKNYDGTVLETDSNVAYGSNPQYNGATPIKAPTAQYVYTFAGWTPTPDLVTGDATYTAKYTQATRGDYTITWKNDDGTVLETDENVAYGSTPEYNGATPTKASDGSYTYEFVGWNPVPTAVRGDATYTAQYRRVGIDHTVTYYDEDRSTVVGAGVVEHGEKISFIPTPTKEPTDQYTYTFKGFLPMDSATPTLVVGETTVLGDYKYYAEYTQTIRKHKISFVDDEGKPIEDILVDYGETPAPSAVPDKTVDGCTYSFSKWTPELVPVAGPATYKASYTKKECKEGSPNTGIGQNDDQASGINIAIILAAFGVLGTLAAAIACRVIKRQRTMKF